MENTPVVRKTQGGNLVWRSTLDRKAAIRRYLLNRGYQTQLTLNAFADKYYVARSTTVVSGLIERTFRTKAQLDKFLREWNRYDRMYDTIEVLERDDIAARAAGELLADA